MNGKFIGNFIKFKRQEIGLTIEQFSAELGVDRFLIEKWENGEIPETQYLVPISVVLHTSVDELLKGLEKVVEEKPKTVEMPPVEVHAEQPQEKKGYYETLNEEISKTDYAHYESVEPCGKDGFEDKERKFGFILCSIFIALILFINGMNIFTYYTRPRELTKDNYAQFLKIDVVTMSSSNVGVYEIRLTRKKNSYDVKNLQITIEIEFEKVFENTYQPGEQHESRQVSLTDELFTAEEELKQTVTLPSIMYIERKITVISVSGEM